MKPFLLILLILGLSCKDAETVDYSLKSKGAAHPGKALMETNCYACHGLDETESNRLAPPMAAVKMHYFSEGISKEEFVADIQKWVKNPNEDDARMFGAVRRFGVMVKTPFPEETVKQIADYMYSSNLDEPEWFQDHIKAEGGNCVE